MKITKRKGSPYYYIIGRDPRNWRDSLCISLKTTDVMEAHIIAGEIAANMARGIEPRVGITKIKKLELPNLKERDQGILDKYIHPFFGEYRPIDVDRELIESYMVSRWGRNNAGELTAVENTWLKESHILIRIMRMAEPLWKLPKIDYKATFRAKLPPLTYEQVMTVGKGVHRKYKAIFWIMVYTGMDIIDTCQLAPCHFKDGWIKKERSKTSKTKKPPIINVPVCKELERILLSVPRPFDKEEPLFKDVSNKCASKEIRKCFTRAGLDGYGSKYLRRYVATVLLDGGYSREWIGKALAHAEGSDVTMEYAGIYEQTMLEAFKLLDR